MIWEIDGHFVEIYIKDIPTIQVKVWTKALKALYMPAQYSEQEAIYYIQQRLKSSNSSKLPSPILLPWTIFDQSFHVKLDPSLGSAIFMKEGRLYSNIKSPAQFMRRQRSLQQQLLHNVVSTSVARWEDYFSLIVGLISFRKYKTKAFHLCLNHKDITFNSSLCHVPLPVLEYLVFQAVAACTSLLDKDVACRKQQFFPLWKNYDKIIDYEFRNAI